MKRIIAVILCLIFIFSFAGCKKEKGITSILSAQSSPADNGISIHLTDAVLDGDKTYVDVEWVNETDEEENYGLQFNIYKVENGKMTSCATEDLYFNEIAVILNPKASHTERYYLEAFDLSEEGTYRFVIEDFPERNLWIDFEITKNTAVSNVGGVDSSNVKAITQ